jgi:hypothetical protein
MNKPTRILTAILVSLVIGGMNAYNDSEKMTPAYQAHPAVTIIANFFWAGLVAGSIFYFGSGLLFKRNNRNWNKADNSSGGGVHLGTFDDKFYDEVARELQEKTVVPGLWTKAFAEKDGDETKTRALYIKYRVAQLAELSRRQHEDSLCADQLAEANRKLLEEALQETQRETELGRISQLRDLCGKCQFFKQTGILDRFKGHCSLHNRKTFSNYGCEQYKLV